MHVSRWNDPLIKDTLVEKKSYFVSVNSHLLQVCNNKGAVLGHYLFWKATFI